MKVVINKCYGGFGLSARAVARIAEIEGRPCFFFRRNLASSFDAPAIPATMEEIEEEMKRTRLGFWSAYDIPDLSVLPSQDNWHSMPMDQRKATNEAWDKHSQESRFDRDKRHYGPLVQAVEELGELANGGFSSLKVIEIPDGVDYEIDDYDGIESVHEVHRSWA